MDAEMNIKNQTVGSLSDIETQSDCYLIDVSEGVLKTGGSKEVYFKILKTFYVDASSRIEQMREAFAAYDFVDLSTYAHSIKSAAASVGIKKLLDFSQQIENFSKNSDIMSLNENIDSYFHLIQTVLLEIEHRFKALVIDPVHKQNMNRSSLKRNIDIAAFAEMAHYISMADFSKADKIFAEIKKDSYVPEIDTVIKKLDLSLRESDYDEVSSTLDLIMEVGYFYEEGNDY